VGRFQNGIQVLVFVRWLPHKTRWIDSGDFFALRAGIGDNTAYPSGSTILFLSRKIIATVSNLANGCMA